MLQAPFRLARLAPRDPPPPQAGEDTLASAHEHPYTEEMDDTVAMQPNLEPASSQEPSSSHLVFYCGTGKVIACDCREER